METQIISVTGTGATMYQAIEDAVTRLSALQRIVMFLSHSIMKENDTYICVLICGIK